MDLRVVIEKLIERIHFIEEDNAILRQSLRDLQGRCCIIQFYLYNSIG